LSGINRKGLGTVDKKTGFAATAGVNALWVWGRSTGVRARSTANAIIAETSINIIENTMKCIIPFFTALLLLV
jgi:hypothetical protein